LGYLELMRVQQGRLDAAAQVRFLNTAIRSGEELLQLVNSVLDGLTITEQMPPPQLGEIAVAFLVRDVVAYLDPGEGQADRLHIDIPDGLTVWANGQLMRQVLGNLLSNAFKYCPKPAPVVVSAALFDRDERDVPPSVCISVQDAGPGIPPEELPLLFQQFTRLKRDDGGPHLGGEFRDKRTGQSFLCAASRRPACTGNDRGIADDEHRHAARLAHPGAVT